MDASVPAVEVADDADAHSVGRPDGEMDAGDAADVERMRAELVVDPGVIALAEQVESKSERTRPKRYGIVDLGDVPVRVRHLEAIRRHVRFVLEHRFEDAGRMPLRHRDGAVAVAHTATDAARRKHRADDEPALLDVRPEHREGIGVPRAGQRDPARKSVVRLTGSDSCAWWRRRHSSLGRTGVSQASRMASSGTVTGAAERRDARRSDKPGTIR